jgi:hypothetical protein
MLVPLTRQKFEELIPRVATGAQYRYCWGKFADFVKRLLISVVAVVVVWLLALVLGDELNILLFPKLIGASTGCGDQSCGLVYAIEHIGATSTVASSVVGYWMCFLQKN